MEVRSQASQHAMEQALGKLVIDGGSRDAFFRDPAVASEAAGIPLTDRERSALTRIRPGALTAILVGAVTEGSSGPRRGT
jgi:hypothetical protein